MPARYITYNLCIKNDTHGVGGTTSSYPKYRLLRDDSVLGAQTTSSVHRQYRHQHMMLHCFCDPSSVWPMGITYDIDYATIPVRLMSSSLRSSYLYRRLLVIPPSFPLPSPPLPFPTEGRGIGREGRARASVYFFTVCMRAKMSVSTDSGWLSVGDATTANGTAGTANVRCVRTRIRNVRAVIVNFITRMISSNVY